jgi:hypothetical protein
MPQLRERGVVVLLGLFLKEEEKGGQEVAASLVCVPG